MHETSKEVYLRLLKSGTISRLEYAALSLISSGNEPRTVREWQKDLGPELAPTFQKRCSDLVKKGLLEQLEPRTCRVSGFRAHPLRLCDPTNIDLQRRPTRRELVDMLNTIATHKDWCYGDVRELLKRDGVTFDDDVADEDEEDPYYIYNYGVLLAMER